MKKFILTISCFFVIPIILLLSIYYWTDPFKILKPFDINDVDATNREYMSTELFIKNKDSIEYNSFIFGSSRAGGFNTYTWKMYLGDNARPYLFQAWSETLSGIYLKLDFLDKNDINIDNAILLFDIPSTFAKEQLPTEVLTLKHYCFTNTSHFQYSMTQFYNFCQKPSLWISSIKKKINNTQIPYSADLITNDWEAKNKDNYDYLPAQDSLKSCSEKTRKTFLYNHEKNKNKPQKVSNQLINNEFLSILEDIKKILSKHKTNYHIVISPAICSSNPRINQEDLAIIENIFGKDKVHNYSECNDITNDYNNFSDPGHFGLRAGYMIFEDIYKNEVVIK